MASNKRGIRMPEKEQSPVREERKARTAARVEELKIGIKEVAVNNNMPIEIAGNILVKTKEFSHEAHLIRRAVRECRRTT